MNHDISNMEQISRHCYYVGLGIGAFALIGVFLVYILEIPILEKIPQCYFLQQTGYYCPGCGGTRAIKALLHGKIINSVYYHPFVGYMTIYYIVFELSHTLNIITSGKVKGIWFCPLYFYIGIAIIIIQWIVKDYLRFFYGFIL